MLSWNTRLKPLAAATLAAAIGVTTGCATVTTGTNQSITVTTIPDGAICLMTREGETVGAISSTPGSLLVGKDRDPIEIECTLEGHITSAESFDSVFHAATLGNVLIGGVIGIAIDAGSGAMNKYPTSIQLVLVPESFATAEARDEFFDEVESKLRATEKAQLEKVGQMCGDDADYCAEERAKIQSAVAERLQDLASKRAAVKVG